MKPQHFISSLVLLLVVIEINCQSVAWVSSGAGDFNLRLNQEIDLGYSICSNGQDIYLTGLSTGNKTYIQNTTLTKKNPCFLLKYDSNGKLQWAKELEGWGKTDAAINSKSEVYVTGPADYDIYIRKYDSAGELIWEKSLFRGGLYFKSNSIAIDSKDNIYVCGTTTLMKGMPVEDTVLPDIDGTINSFILKYNDAGEFQWIRYTQGGVYSEFNDIKIDLNDDLVLIGNFCTGSDSLMIGTTYIRSVINEEVAYPPNTQDVLIAKYSSDGEFRWVNTFGGIGGINNSFGNKVSINNLNEINIIGSYIDSLRIDDFKLISHGSNDIFLCKLSPDGKAIWVETAGGNNGAYPNGIETGKSIDTDSKGNIYISGSIIGSAVFGKGSNEITVTTDKSYTQAGFIAMYTKDGDLSFVIAMSGGRSIIEDIFYENSRLLVTGNFYPEAKLIRAPIPVSSNETTNFFLASVILSPYVSEASLQKNTMTIYPNPTKGILRIDSEDSNEITRMFIYNIQGELMKRYDKYEPTIDISDLPQGIYVLKTSTDVSYAITKIIKNN